MKTAQSAIEQFEPSAGSIGKPQRGRVLLSLAGAVAISCLWPMSPCLFSQDTIDPTSPIELEPDSARPSTATGASENVDRFVDDLLLDAKRYATGTDYAYNPVRAFELYKKAAETGNVTAVYEVARFMILGEGTAKNEAKGLAILNDLAAVLVQGKGFRQVKGFNPVTKAPFKEVKDLKRSTANLASFKTKGGTLIEGPEVLSIVESGPRMMHSTGVTAFTWEELPAFVQLQVGYDKVSSYLQTAIEKALATKK
ncbi:MAG: sel1 repeat family protein [Verrucomicrobiae bacterium]|nr:sel1 repeat family protein [Verrucomicrobiae bacterium]